ncbi:hypothetical protein EJ08DRAFT_650756 [Tothia fuscella]|uniref:Uncharacterized protein n=1 Tax=Tothia fuscella TaxID=1048955 RepID=A0A9P4NNX0_9PEZI|nr:hypothetical protein EJ08DRAFT_650756 [Tothia fuscella]
MSEETLVGKIAPSGIYISSLSVLIILITSLSLRGFGPVTLDELFNPLTPPDETRD